ncbi:MerR family transcriptional regulator [Arenimonas aestuarii]
MPPRPSFDIGEAARRVGVSPATLRLYERRGLLPPAKRSLSGYRKYSAEDLRRARLVRRARKLGLSMAEVADAVTRGGSGLLRLLRSHLSRLDCELHRKARLRRHLRRWLSRHPGP